MEKIDTKEIIAKQNDLFRKNAILFPQSGRLFVSHTVAADPKLLEICLDKTFNFDTFTEDNDPWGEHDFGSFDVESVNYFWKIEEPEEPGAKVLFIFPASEY
jgi:hypothetical protein